LSSGPEGLRYVQTGWLAGFPLDCVSTTHQKQGRAR